MNRALWKKTLRDAFWPLLTGCALLVAFHWLMVYAAKQAPIQPKMLERMPDFVKRALPVDFMQLLRSNVRLAFFYEHPLVQMIVVGWAIARGSDCVSGELGRGTMELILAQPITRVGLIVSQGLATIGGCALLAASAWIGSALGGMTITLDPPVEPRVLTPAATNLAALGICVSGLATLASSWDRYRWRSIGLMVGLYVIESALAVMARAIANWEWLRFGTFLTFFSPSRIVIQGDQAWRFAAQYPGDRWELGGLGCNVGLVGIGLIAYAAAAVIFCRRDLPAPL